MMMMLLIMMQPLFLFFFALFISLCIFLFKRKIVFFQVFSRAFLLLIRNERCCTNRVSLRRWGYGGFAALSSKDNVFPTRCDTKKIQEKTIPPTSPSLAINTPSKRSIGALPRRTAQDCDYPRSRSPAPQWASDQPPAR